LPFLRYSSKKLDRFVIKNICCGFKKASSFLEHFSLKLVDEIQVIGEDGDALPQDVDDFRQSVDVKKKVKTKTKRKRQSSGDILEFDDEEKKASKSRVKIRHNSEVVDVEKITFKSKPSKSSKKDELSNDKIIDSLSTNTADGVDSRKCDNSTKVRSVSMSSLSSFKTKRTRPNYFRSQSR